MSDEEIIEVVSVLKTNDKTMKDNGISDNLWGKAIECIMFLQSENAILCEKLEKAVELKARVGDIVYIPWINDGKDAIAELPINKISIHKDDFVLYWVDLSKCDRDYIWVAPKPNYTHSDFGSVVFLTREAAKAHLAELKGGNKR